MRIWRNIWAIFLRELGAYFLSPIAWVVLFLFLIINGATFYLFARIYAEQPRQITLIVESLFGFSLFWILPLSPLLTMRLVAEEKRVGSLELLMTAPVGEAEVVLGKFLAAQAFYTLVWLSLTPLFVILEVLGDVDWGPIGAVYCGLFALGFLTNALGVLASTVTRNQLVAAVLALSGNLVLFYIPLTQSLLSPDALDAARFVRFLSFTSHFEWDYSKGIVDLRYLALYGSLTAFLLFLSVRVLEARKWR